jgi:hypothetical protein
MDSLFFSQICHRDRFGHSIEYITRWIECMYDKIRRRLTDAKTLQRIPIQSKRQADTIGRSSALYNERIHHSA